MRFFILGVLSFICSLLNSQNSNTTIELDCISGSVEKVGDLTVLKNGINVKNNGTTFKYLSAPIQLTYRGNLITLTGSNNVSTTKNVRNIRPFLTTNDVVNFVSTCNSTNGGSGGSGDNIYTADGTITEDRTVDLDNNRLNFTNGQLRFEAYGAGTNSHNTSSGAAILGVNTATGDVVDDVLFRRAASLGMYSVPTASFGIFLGLDAGYNTSGSYNTFIGRDAGRENTTGGNNKFFGFGAGRENTTGSFNNNFGRDAGLNNTSGEYNNNFGRSAGLNNTTGGNNFNVGYNAGRYNRTGSYNIAIGNDAGTAIDDTLFNYTIALGRLAKVNATGHIKIGNPTYYNKTTLVGNVGITTDNPTETLHTIGKIRFQGYGMGDVITESPFSSILSAVSTSGNVVESRIYAFNDKLGIANSAPEADLHIGTSAGTNREIIMQAGTTFATAIRFRRGSVSRGLIGVNGSANQLISGSVGGDFNLRVASGGSINFSTDDGITMGMRMNGGRLNIGTQPFNSSRLNVFGDIEVSNLATGVVLLSPNGNRWRVQIDNSGNLITTAL